MLTSTRSRSGRLAAFVVVALGLAGCEEEPPLTTEGRAGCEGSGADYGEGPRMLPGSACLTCHHFSAAGTVFDLPTSACSSGGVSGATVEISSLSGEITASLTTNSVGNFYTNAPLPSPFRVRIVGPDGTVRVMATPQTNGSCAHCHRAPPAEAAPGRIFVGAPLPSVDAGATDQ